MQIVISCSLCYNEYTRRACAREALRYATVKFNFKGKSGMKIKLLGIILALATMLSLLASCGGGEAGDNGEGGGNTDTPTVGGYVYNSELGVLPNIICTSDERIPSTYTDIIRNAIRKNVGDYPNILPEGAPEGMHEIVIGETDRAISVKAYRRLKVYSRSQLPENVNWLVYSDGNSLAIAYDRDDGFITLETAAKYLRDEVIGNNTSLKLGRGVVASGSFSDIEYYREIDKANIEKAWQRLEDALVERIGKEDAAEFVAAMKQLYGIYDSDVVRWFANLYDPAVGGFYFSNSGRNSENYLPDIESTAQALGFIESSGMGYLVGGYDKCIPEWMAKQIISYLKGLQDKNGFFYHPQWGKELTDTKISRRARDLGNAVGVLRRLGSAPTYDTPTGDKGDGILADGTQVSRSFLTEPMNTSVVNAVSFAVLAASYADHLENEETFRAYLEKTKKEKSSFYAIGNQITSEMPQIIARDSQLKAAGATYSLVDITIEWFNQHQDPETGLWGFDAKAPADYLGVNGLLKISGIYTKAEVEIPYAEKAARAAIAAISSDEKMSAVVDLYNTWYSIGNVIDNLTAYGKTVEIDGVSMTGTLRAKAIRDALYVEAIPAIIKSAEKIADFEKPDGSFSYGRLYSSTTSQGMPVALPNSDEGDVNATVIAINGIKNHIYESLGLNGYKVPLFGEAERRIYVNILNELGPVIKYQADIVVDSPINFDDDVVGAESPYVEKTMKSDGTLLVMKDPRGAGNVLEFNSNPADTGDSVIVNNNIFFPEREVYIFKGDFCFDKAKSKSATAIQLFVGRTHMISFSIDVEKNTVTLTENTYNSWKSTKSLDLATLKLDEWFNLRVEYYPDANGDVRIKMYINDKLIAVTNNYYGKHLDTPGTPAKDISYTQIFALSGADVTVYLDNLHTYNTDDPYVLETADDLVCNVDLEKPAFTYDFEGTTDVPASLSASGAEIVKSGENSLLKQSAGAFTAKVNQVDADPGTYTFKAKLTADLMADGDTLNISFVEAAREAVSVNISVVRNGNSISIINVGTGDEIAKIALTEGKALLLEISYNGGNIKVSADGNAYASFKTTLNYYGIYGVDLVKATYTGSGSILVDDLYFNSTKA